MRKPYIFIIFTLIFAIVGCGDSACYDKLKEVDSRHSCKYPWLIFVV